jgi:aryl-alcohol dehydrogenase-like predicted oxidoreductase
VSVVVGARTPQEIEENVALSAVEITDDVWELLG